MNQGMLSVNNLVCGYDSKVVIRDVTFGLGKGEILGVIGPNGCGKTTLLRAITRLIKPQRGNILLDGRDIRSLSIGQIAKKIAVVSQGPVADLDMAVEDYVLLGRLVHRGRFQFMETPADEKAAFDALDLTGALKFKERPLCQLSGGERQLAFISRALAQQPGLLLLDEPTSHLDITHQVEILDLMHRLNAEMGLAVIIVLHDLNLAAEYCQRLLLLNSGALYKIGIPEEVLTYQIIEELYKTVVVVEKNPVSSKPYVLVVSEKEKRKRGKNG